jgi:subtilase family serine protease
MYMGSTYNRGIFVVCFLFVCSYEHVWAAYRFIDFEGRPPIHILGSASTGPVGITPDIIKKIYNIPATGGSGTIAIIAAYDDSSIESDLAEFDAQFNLPECTVKNGCFEKHPMNATIKANSGWGLETTLDVEWAHAIAPNAKILLVEATTPSGPNFIKAIDYATARSTVTEVSMSWGGAEFPEEVGLDSHFTSSHPIVFLASSGDSGSGASWPAASPNVIAVGGTTLSLKIDGTFIKETAWKGSGGGISSYESAPSFQSIVAIPKSLGMRAIPDVSYDADPKSGFPIVRAHVWRRVGGTSAGAPQWAAIVALGTGVSLKQLYADKAGKHSSDYFRDITSGSNGSCGYICIAHAQYDYVTGLGSPQTVTF